MFYAPNINSRDGPLILMFSKIIQNLYQYDFFLGLVPKQKG